MPAPETPPRPVRIVGLDLEPVRDFRAQHTRQAGAYRALDARPQFEVVSVTTPRPPASVTRLIQLAYIRPGRSRWRQRSGLSTPGFRARTLSADRILSARDGEFDVVFQVGCTFAPGRGQRPRPYTVYVDCTLLLTHRNWRPAAPHGPSALRRWVSLEREVYRRAHHVFTMSEWARASLIDDYGIEPGRVTATGAGTNLIPAQDALSAHDAPIALFVGREWERKGGPALLSAWPAVARAVPGAQLWIVGTGDQPRASEDVTWHGRVGPDALRALYRQASVFVLPTRYDMSPHVIREALGYGLPCVTTTVGGIPEIVEDGVDSLLVAPGDVAGLSQSVIELLRDRELAASMGAAGRERVLRELTWERVTERMAPHLLSAAGRADR
jgi:alpha-maltose-1-phosphate synthase